MSRDSSGNYNLPSGNPVAAFTTIESVWANTTMSDLATGLTNSLDRQGRGGMLASLKGLDGSLGVPAYSFNDFPTSGMWVDNSALHFSYNGVEVTFASQANLDAHEADDEAHSLSLNNLIATTDPAVTDDNTAGYSVNSVWVNTATDKVFHCADAATGAAVWSAGGGGAAYAHSITTPADPVETPSWWDTETGDAYQYFENGANAPVYVAEDPPLPGEGVSGGGDVFGPAGGVVADEIALYSDTTGKLIKGSGGAKVSDFGDVSYAGGGAADNDLIVFDGASGTSIKSSGKDAAFVLIQSGAGPAGNIPSYLLGGLVLNDSGVAAADIVIGPVSAVNERIAVFDSISGKLLKDGGSLISDLEPADATILKDADIGGSVQAHDAVLDATTASFLTADETKLDAAVISAIDNTMTDLMVNIVSGTQAQYDASSKSATTLYIIVG